MSNELSDALDDITRRHSAAEHSVVPAAAYGERRDSAVSPDHYKTGVETDGTSEGAAAPEEGAQ